MISQKTTFFLVIIKREPKFGKNRISKIAEIIFFSTKLDKRLPYKFHYLVGVTIQVNNAKTFISISGYLFKGNEGDTSFSVNDEKLYSQ